MRWKGLVYRVCIVLALVILSQDLYGQVDGSAKVGVVLRVVDGASEASLAGVHVIVEPEGLNAISGPDGVATFTTAAHPMPTIEARMLGYATALIVLDTDSLLGDTLTISLEQTSVTLSELLVEHVSLLGSYQSAIRMPGAVDMIGPAELAQFAYSDVGRVLAATPGVYIQEEDGYGLRPNVGIRGSGTERSSKITLMEDGILAAPAPYAAPAAYYFPSIARMHAVEVRKGSSQIESGPYTTGGALNLVSTPIPEGALVRADLFAGGFEGQNMRGVAGGTVGPVGVLVEGLRIHSGGFKRLDGGGDTGFLTSDLVVKSRYALPNGRQSVSAKYAVATESSRETYLGLTEADYATSPFRRYVGSKHDRMETRFEAAHVRYSGVSSDDVLRWTSTLYGHRFHRNWYKIGSVVAEGSTVGIGTVLMAPAAYPSAMSVLLGSSDGLINVRANNRNYQSRGFDQRVTWRLNSMTEVRAGIRLHRDEVDYFQWEDQYAVTLNASERTVEGIPGSQANRVVSAHAMAAYTTVDLDFGKLHLTPGVRREVIAYKGTAYGRDDTMRTGLDVERSSSNVAVVLPGIGISYDLSDLDAVFFGAHKGFAPPGLSDDARPETAVNIEAGYRRVATVAKLQVVAYYAGYNNLLGVDLAAAGGSGTGDLFNGGRARAWGLEVSGSYNLGALMSWRMSVPVGIDVTLARSSFLTSFESDFDGWGTVSAGDPIPYTAPSIIAASAGLGTDRLDLSIRARWQANVWSVPGVSSNASGYLPAYAVTDASMSYRVSPTLTAIASAQNIFDEHYIASTRPAGLRPGMPRQIQVGLRYVLQ